MSGFYFTFLAVLLAGIGARDQVMVAGLTRMQGTRSGLLVTALVTSMASGVFAAWAGASVAPLMPPTARVILAALALAIAAAEMLLLPAPRRPREPTRSLGALALVLLSHQLADAARFLVFAVAIATGAPLAAGLGGVVAGMASVGAGWLLPDPCLGPRIRTVRRSVAVVLLIVGIGIALRALGRL